MTKDGAAVTTTPTRGRLEAHGLSKRADQAVTGSWESGWRVLSEANMSCWRCYRKDGQTEKNKAAATPDAIAQAEKGVADTQKEIAQNQKASDTAANATQKAWQRSYYPNRR